MQVSIEKGNQKSVALFKYMDVIRKAQLNYGRYACAHYDEEFRARITVDQEAQWGS